MSLQSIVGVVIQVKFSNKHVERSLINFALQKSVKDMNLITVILTLKFGSILSFTWLEEKIYNVP